MTIAVEIAGYYRCGLQAHSVGRGLSKRSIAIAQEDVDQALIFSHGRFARDRLVQVAISIEVSHRDCRRLRQPGDWSTTSLPARKETAACTGTASVTMKRATLRTM
jgi:hypothetical protein